MDSNTLYTIIAIIAAIIILEVYKRERNRVTSNLHNDNLKQLLTIATLDYKYGNWQTINETDRKQIEKKLTVLVNQYEKGELHSSAFQKKVDGLLNKNK